MEIISYISHSEVFGKKIDLDEFRKRLARLDVNQVVYICAVCNLLLRTFANLTDKRLQDLILRDFYPPSVVQAFLNASTQAGNRRSVIHRQQLLFLIKEALANCSDKGTDALSEEGRIEMGHLLLAANDLLHNALPKPSGLSDQVIHVVADFIPVTEASGFHEPLNKIIRTHLIQKFLDKEPFDFELLFRGATGLSLTDYVALCFGAVARWGMTTYESLRSDVSAFWLTDQFFSKLKISQQDIQSFLGNVSATREELKAKIDKSVGANDFTALRDKPLLSLNGAYIVLDLPMLTEKIEVGPFWAVNFALPAERRIEFHAYWGNIFERYVCWLFQSSISLKHSSFYKNPSFEDGSEIADAILCHRDEGVFIEMKGSTFTSKAKYGRNPELLKSEIEEKLIETKDGEPKGLKQLARSIERVFGTASSTQMPLKRLKKIYPLLILRDDIGSSLAINCYLNLRFSDILSKDVRTRIDVAPLTVLAAEDLEKLTSLLGKVSLPKLLSSYHLIDPTLRAPFWTVAERNPVITSAKLRRLSPYWQAYKEFSTQMTKSLFLTSDLASKAKNSS